MDKAINDTQVELAAAQQEKEAVANNKGRLVLTEKKERRIAETLTALEQAKAAATYTPAGADRPQYRDTKAKKVAKVAAEIRTAEREQS